MRDGDWVGMLAGGWDRRVEVWVKAAGAVAGAVGVTPISTFQERSKKYGAAGKQNPRECVGRDVECWMRGKHAPPGAQAPLL